MGFLWPMPMPIFLQNQDSRWPIYDADFFFADMFGWFSFFPPSDKI